jgi:hypothetical protein
MLFKIISVDGRLMKQEYGAKAKTKYSEKNLPRCHLIHYKSHGDQPGVEPEPPP